MKLLPITRTFRNVAFVSFAVVVLGACGEGGSSYEGSASCKLKSFTVDHDKSRMCIYTCKGGELEGRTRSKAQGACLEYVPSAK